MDLTLWLAFVAASSLLLIIPGPTILLVLSYGISQGRRVAVASALGVALGDLIAMSASLAGLGALVMTSATAFTVLKWVGAAYLAWMGIRLWRAAPDTAFSLPDANTSISSRAVFGHTATVTALNPKSIGFFIAFVPQFVTPHGPVLPQFATLTATFVTLALLNALAFALMADGLRSRLKRPPVLRAITRAGGATLMGMAVMTASLRRAA